MSKVLIKFSRDWCDEFNCDGFRVVDSQEEADEIKKVWSKPRWFYFGTNEGWEPEHQLGNGYPGGVLANSMTFTEITDEEAETLIKLFDLNGETKSYGIIPTHWDDDEDDDEW